MCCCSFVEIASKCNFLIHAYPVAYAEICKGGGFGAENVIALSSPGNGQKLPKLGLHSKIKCFGFKNILQ